MLLGRTLLRAYSTAARSKLPNGFWQKYQKQIKLAGAGTTVAILLGFGYCEWTIHTRWTKELDQDQFTRYRISQRVDIDPYHYFLELKPLSHQSVNIWQILTSKKIWSVEVKQPEIMIVRKYTPLPLKLTPDDDDYRLEPLDITNGDDNDGKLLFYLKNYDTGEVARWLRNLDVGSRVDLRGPYVEYEIKGNIKELTFFTAGTGVVSALQILLNNSSPYSDKLNWVHTSHSLKDLGPLYPKLLEIGKLQNTQLMLFDDKHPLRENLNEVKKLIPINSNNLEFNKAFVSLICGPEGFISTIAGSKQNLDQGPVGGILNEKGWSNKNVFKL